MYDYATKAEAERDIPKMKAKGWRVKDQYEQLLDIEYTYTVEYMYQH